MRPEQNYDDEPGAKCCDVAQERGLDFIDGFSVRFADGPQTALHWQVGRIVQEQRHYRDPGMTETFHRTVTLFRLLGYGPTCSDALAMAHKNGGRNGR